MIVTCIYIRSSIFAEYHVPRGVFYAVKSRVKIESVGTKRKDAMRKNVYVAKIFIFTKTIIMKVLKTFKFYSLSLHCISKYSIFFYKFKIIDM